VVGRPGVGFPRDPRGYISVTPLHLDLTNYRLLEDLGGWDLKL
jgi:broad specificity polyphosphatase/5'/3'-nucleotidase SurE